MTLDETIKPSVGRAIGTILARDMGSTLACNTIPHVMGCVALAQDDGVAAALSFILGVGMNIYTAFEVGQLYERMKYNTRGTLGASYTPLIELQR